MMKQGAHPHVVFGHLVTYGVDQHAARALVDQLVAFKMQADALEPNRLREEVKWMLVQGATEAQATAHLVHRGVAEEHARPEVQRLAREVAESAPCDGCRMPTPKTEVWFDRHGRQLCRRCHAVDELGTAKRRVVESTLENLGVSPFAVQMASAASYSRDASAVPYCARCDAYSGTAVAGLRPAERARAPHGYTHVCGRCWAGLR